MKRYQQQLSPLGGREGQQKLAHGRVLIVGAGGLGTPVATYLAAAGVGTIGLVDGDTVAETNLHRQFQYTPSDVGASKTGVLAQALRTQNPAVMLVEYPQFAHASFLGTVLPGYDLVCDCTDNAEARIALDAACAAAGKPLVFAAVRDWEGYLTVFHHRQGRELASLFPADVLRSTAETCAGQGIMPVVCGVLGSLQAGEALKLLLGREEILEGKILCVNTLTHTYRTFTLLSSSSGNTGTGGQ